MDDATVLDVLIACPTAPIVEKTAAWREVEAALGVELPADYKYLVERLGAFTVRRDFCVFSPFSAYAELVHQSKVQADILRRIRNEVASLASDGSPPLYRIPWAVHPEPGGLIPWAVTGNGDVCCWLPEPDSTAPSVVVVDNGFERWQHFQMTTKMFLLGLATGGVKVEWFPEELLGDPLADLHHR